jgi:signal transduction histidine kinase
MAEVKHQAARVVLWILIGVTILISLLSLVMWPIHVVLLSIISFVLLAGLLRAHDLKWQWSAQVTTFVITLLVIISASPTFMQEQFSLPIFVPVIIGATLLTPRWAIGMFTLTMLGVAANIWIQTGTLTSETLGPTFETINLILEGSIVSGIIVASAITNNASHRAEAATTALQATNVQLQATNTALALEQALLEQKVADRTASLAQKNEDLQRAIAAAEEANRLKTKFLANMSHELRTPLNAIIGFIEMLLRNSRGDVPREHRPYLVRVLSNAEHLLGLINDILDIAKIEAGQIVLLFEEVDLTALLRGVAATGIGLTKDKGLTLTLDCPEELPTVLIDKTRIRQVLLNLLSNATKFTHQGGISLRVKYANTTTVRIEVQDTGIGIAAEDQALIFEDFRQVQDDISRAYQGTGLGLSISRRLVELHGGQMWVESNPGQGSTFCFTVPIAIQSATSYPDFRRKDSTP